jgi:ATP-dependent Clp protease adaptor protein ClpS
MSPSTIEKPKALGPGSGLGGNWLVIVRNDDHNTFEHVARTLARCIPGIDYDRGMALANKIHSSGRAVVWRGMREPAEHYWQQLASAGLTMAPLEQS